MRKTQPEAPSLPPPPPVDSPVYSVESGWTGVVVRHVAGSVEDRPHRVVPVVKWDKNGVESKERPGRVRVYELGEKAVLSVHDGRLAVRHLKNLVHGETCAFWQSRMGRPDGETCAQYRSHIQGSTMPGCFHCEAVAFLKRLDPSFDPHSR